MGYYKIDINKIPEFFLKISVSENALKGNITIENNIFTIQYSGDNYIILDLNYKSLFDGFISDDKVFGTKFEIRNDDINVIDIG